MTIVVAKLGGDHRGDPDRTGPCPHMKQLGTLAFELGLRIETELPPGVEDPGVEPVMVLSCAPCDLVVKVRWLP